jgi:hypothetical protein
VNAWIAAKDPAVVSAIADRIAEKEPTRIDNAAGDRSFAVWMLGVDRALRATTGFNHSDLPDWSWRNAYDDDLTPVNAAADALQFWHEYGDL